MNEKIEKYLPIGTVVLLKNATKKIMITGFCIIANSDNKKIYDYAGCLYPEGVITPQQTLLFNHNQISLIYHFGYNDEESKKFLEDVKNKMKDKK